MNKTNKGITVVELIIVLVILCLFILILTPLFIRGCEILREEKAIKEAYEVMGEINQAALTLGKNLDNSSFVYINEKLVNDNSSSRIVYANEDFTKEEHLRYIEFYREKTSDGEVTYYRYVAKNGIELINYTGEEWLIVR